MTTALAIALAGVVFNLVILVVPFIAADRAKKRYDDEQLRQHILNPDGHHGAK